MIKKFLTVLFAGIIFFGCDKINDDIVDPDFSVVSVTSVSAPNFVVFSPSDSSFTASISFENSDDIGEVWFKLSSSDGLIEISNFTVMKDDGDSRNGDQTAGDNRYSGKILLSRSYPYSNYNLEFFVRDLNDRVQKAAVHSFLYDNGKFNAAPVIESIFAPDTVVVEDPKSVFVVAAEVSDSNGINDIADVWFTTIRPDSTTSGARLFLNDLGIDGDEIAGDGKYSIIVEVTPANSKGTYSFNFQAQDRRQSLSEIVSYNITLE